MSVGHSGRPIEIGSFSRDFIAVKAGISIARYGCNDACPCVQPANAAVLRVNDKKVLFSIYRHRIRCVQLGINTRASVTAKSRGSCPCQRSYDPSDSIDLANPMVA